MLRRIIVSPRQTCYTLTIVSDVCIRVCLLLHVLGILQIRHHALIMFWQRKGHVQSAFALIAVFQGLYFDRTHDVTVVRHKIDRSTGKFAS